MPNWTVKVGWNDHAETFETNAMNALDAADSALELIYTCVDRTDEYKIQRVGIEVTPR